MTKDVEIRATRSFNRTPQGDLCEVGDRFPVAESRADELERLGLAVKIAPEPENKMAPAPENKSGRKPRIGA